MHPFSILTLGIFVAGYITARWDLVTRLYELAIFAWDHGVVSFLLITSRRERANWYVENNQLIAQEQQLRDGGTS
ncbi:hypothetical protein MAP00_002214 [Monascus purpureus]|nr:hypothetical protein MAP00_002214 [Monascus purpureus]